MPNFFTLYLQVVVEGKLPSSVVHLSLSKRPGPPGNFNVIVAGSTRVDFNHVAISSDHRGGRRDILATKTYAKFNNIVRCLSIREGNGEIEVVWSCIVLGKKFIDVLNCRFSVRISSHHFSFAVSDGKLAAAGDHSGLVQAFETVKRTQLRRMRGHTGPVNACSFSSQNRGFVLTGGDDTVCVCGLCSKDIEN